MDIERGGVVSRVAVKGESGCFDPSAFLASELPALQRILSWSAHLILFQMVREFLRSFWESA